MKNYLCSICGKTEFEVRNTYLMTSKLFLNYELYYIRICKCCGKTDLFNAKIVDESKCDNLKIKE